MELAAVTRWMMLAGIESITVNRSYRVVAHVYDVVSCIGVSGGDYCMQGDPIHTATVASNLLRNHRLVDWTAVLDLGQGAWGSLSGPRTPGVLESRVISFVYSLSLSSSTLTF